MQTFANRPIPPRELDKSAHDPLARVDNNWMHTQAGAQDWPKHHCKQTWKAAQPFLTESQGRLAVDVGARDGEFTRYLLRGFDQVVCFEPRRREFFDRNTPPDAPVTLFQCALGDEAGEIVMAGGGHDLERTPKRSKVKVLTLDQFELECVDLIKIDVEGYELKVLRGAEKTILKWWPTMIVEKNQVALEGEDPDGALLWLRARGYRVAATCPRGWDHILVHEA